uniref:CHY-type domain-containing protein n=1 Tax=Arcella intermedia TaxID=1963864 RepID=A0A6B2L349_9EUKA
MESENRFRVGVPPRSREGFPYSIKELLLHFIIHPKYPHKLGVVRVVNSGFPERLKLNIVKQITDYFTENREKLDRNPEESSFNGKSILLVLLTWVQDNLIQLMIDKEITKEYKQKQQTNNLGNDSSSDYTYSSSDDEDESPLQSNTPKAPIRRGIGLQCCGFAAINGVLLESSELNLLGVCKRCKTETTFTIKANQNNTPAQDPSPSQGYHTTSQSQSIATPTLLNHCSNCGYSMALLYTPDMVHQQNSTIGYVDLEGATLTDCLTCSFYVTCGDCNNKQLFKQFSFGTDNIANCFQCHKIIKVNLEGIKFVKLAPSIVMLNVGEKKKKIIVEKLDLEKGKPLPHKGTCKHYQKSKRWLRFPCCGKAYPCDLCHDATADHEAMWAKRMICGYCSVEQPFNDTLPCKSCGQYLSPISTNKNHWEGGTGCRDQTKMSKKDNKKYRGQTKPTPKNNKNKKTKT